MRVFLLGSPTNKAHPTLLSAWTALGIDVALVDAAGLPDRLDPDDVVVARLDVLPTLDGVEPGLLDLLVHASAGIRVVNGARSLVRAHDKLVTARCLQRAGLPHPQTVVVRRGDEPVPEPPVVVKPRFGSWGRDVYRCETRADLTAALRLVAGRPWFRRHGTLVQELVPPPRCDLRLLVAAGKVVGAAERVAARDEWRTNAALGGTVRPVEPPAGACELGLAAARAIDSDFVGIDLLPSESEPAGYVVLELNGAVEFRPAYSLPGRDVFQDVARALELLVEPAHPPGRSGKRGINGQLTPRFRPTADRGESGARSGKEADR